MDKLRPERILDRRAAHTIVLIAGPDDLFPNVWC
jgi:hypothetical protein